VPELRRLFKLASELDPEWISTWVERQTVFHGGDPIDLVASTPQEVERVRQTFGRSLPASYLAYLEVMGEYHGMANPHYAMLYRWIRTYNEEWVPQFLQELRERDGLAPDALKVPPEAVFVGGHDGYDYLFLCEDGDDPQGWSLNETNGVIKIEHADGSPFRFSEIVLRGIESSVRSSRHAWRLKNI